jgi:hypothetical protein
MTKGMMMNDVSQIFLILLMFEFKKLLCDYPIHPTFILKKFQSENYKAFAFHSFVHSFFTFLIISIMTDADMGLSLTLSFFEYIVHFALSLWKSRSQLMARFRPLDLDEFLVADKKSKFHHRMYWGIFAVDRMIHQGLYLLILYVLCSRGLVYIM